MAKSDALEKYRLKRDFNITSEPSGAADKKAVGQALSFVIQKHWASRLHYDFRLEFEGTLKSWAVPKGPSLDPHDKRMAVQVEDHPVSYGSFEGTIPPKQYGAGQVIVWDRGTWTPLEDAAKGFRDGKLKFELQGDKLKGRWTLVRMHGKGDERQPPWLLIKERDAHVRPSSEYDITEALPDSVMTTARSAALKPSVNKPAATTASKKVAAARKNPPRANARAKAADAADLPDGAVKVKKLPALLEPQLATLVESAPAEGDWLYELKFDGYRLMARLDDQAVQCFTRNGHDWTGKMPQLAQSLKALALQGTWLDGEIIVPDADGLPDFQALQNAFEGRGRRVRAGAPPASPNAAAIVYYVFDIPFFAGHDLRDVPLIERRALLQQLMQKNASPNLRFSDAFDAPSRDLVSSACKLGFEGLIGKRADAPYQSRRSPDWIKLKCGQRQEFVICGFTEPKGSRSGLGALLLGIHDKKGKLQYAGNVGSGFNEKVLVDLRARLDKLEVDERPFEDTETIPGRPHWVQPKLLAEISFAEWTQTNRVRHAVFRGLRADKPPKAITREKPMPPSALPSAKKTRAAKTAVTAKAASKASVKKPPKKIAAKAAAKAVTSKPAARAASTARKAAVKTPTVSGKTAKKPVATTPAKRAAAPKKTAGKSGAAAVALPQSLRVTNADRVIDTDSGLTKIDLVTHYATVSALMMPHLKGRPVSLVRAPSGTGGELFFQKHAKEDELPGIRLLDPALDRDHDSLLEVTGLTGLLSAAQMNTLEFHTWNATASAIGKPDRMTFDLDPGDGIAWPQMQEAAMLVKAFVEELGLTPFLKTSGGKGLHVVIPLKRQHGWDTVKDFSQAVVQHLAKTLPDRFVAKSGPKNRIGKIFADYLRNGFGATTVAAWSARARPGMGVSVPVGWDELTELTSGAHWTVDTLEERLATGNTPWDDYAQSAKPLGPAMKALGFKP
ncbi:MAG: DNA ligase D [Polaromonas sp.]|nr:DNA ligase D [Polaromonas sp.]